MKFALLILLVSLLAVSGALGAAAVRTTQSTIRAATMSVLWFLALVGVIAAAVAAT